VGPKVGELVDAYLRGRLERGELQWNSAKKMRPALAVLVEVTGDGPARKIDRAAAEAWKARVAHLKPSTQRLRHTTVSCFCEWLVDEEILRRNPFRQVKPPKAQRRPPRALPHEGVARLYDVVPDVRGRVIVSLMVQQGLRCMEVSGLTVGDVDLEERTMRVSGKFGHERVLPVTEGCVADLTLYLLRHPAAGPWAPLVRAWRPNGGSMRTTEPVASDRPLSAYTLSKMVTEWMVDAGIKRSPRDGVSAHALRHTCATDMLAGGADLLEVRDVLGHTSVATTQVYLSVQPGRLASAMGGRSYDRPVLREVS
jgi:site-specific recombinase XerD